MGMSPNRGGMESVIMNYARALYKEDFRFDYITYNGHPYCQDEITELGGRCFIVAGRSKYPIKNQRELSWIFREHGVEYSALWYNCCLITDMNILKLADKAGIPKIIVHSHNSKPMGNLVQNRMHESNKKKIKRYATDFWACSQSAGEFFYSKSILKSPEYRVIKNAINTENFVFDENARQELRAELGVGPENLLLGNVGRFHPQKNQEFLLEIFKETVNLRPEARLVIVGQGELESKLKKSAADMGISDKVIFTGQRSDVAKLYSAMDAFALPSLYEGLPVTLVEAQTSGLACFTSSEAVTDEAAATSELKFLSLKDGARKWAEALAEIQLISSEKRMETGKKLCQSDWNIDLAAKDMGALLS